MKAQHKTTAFWFIALSYVALCFAQNTRVVSTPMGTVAGEISQGLNTGGSTVFQFLGVPYAKAPIAENRFKAPVYPDPQDGIINLQKYGRPCFQDRTDLEDFIQNSRTSDESSRLSAVSSEDCLYLNIYSPAVTDDEYVPVMVFIHGGNFNMGTGNAYKGTELARLNKVVVVTLNYRLGVFGFLSGDGNDSSLSGNFGILDQQMALKWVQDNIQNFGGDIDKITLFGEEAGGASVHFHLLDHQENEGNATGVFQNAIIQSSPYDDGLWTDEQSIDAYYELITNLEDLSGKTNITADELTDEQLFPSSTILQATTKKWHPNVGIQISEAMEQGKYKKEINVIVGSNSAAGKGQITNVEGDDWLKNVTRDVIETAFTQKYKLTEDQQVVDKMSKNYLQFYSWFGVEDVSTVSTVRESFSAILYGDQVYRSWAQSIAESLSASSCNCSVYGYLFNKKSGIQGVPQGSQLSDELKYLFGYDNSDTILTQRMMTLWCNFANTGNPNSENDIEVRENVQQWLTYENEFDDDCRNLVKIESAGKLVAHKDEIATRTWQFWEAFYDTLEFSCSKQNSTIANDEDDLNQIDSCEQTVGELLGWDMTNETAAILMITFMGTTGLFVLACLIIFGCFCHLKRKIKKSMKKMKSERKGQDNSGFAYKL